MLTRDAPFDPADDAEAETELGLLNDVLVSQDVAFVVAALRTIFEASGKNRTCSI